MKHYWWSAQQRSPVTLWRQLLYHDNIPQCVLQCTSLLYPLLKLNLQKWTCVRLTFYIDIWLMTVLIRNYVFTIYEEQNTFTFYILISCQTCIFREIRNIQNTNLEKELYGWTPCQTKPMKQTYLQKLKLVKYTVNSTVHRNPEHRAKCSFYRPVANTGHQTELN